MSVELPGELRDMIVDHLFDDKAALTACSLVCQEWLHSARYHLFRYIRLSPFRRNSSGDWLQDSKIFLDSSPTICPFIKELVVSGSNSRTSFIDVSKLVDVIADLHALERLSIVRLGLQISLEESRAPSVISPRPLRQLYLGFVNCESVVAVRTLLPFFSSIQIFQGVDFTVEEDEVDTSSRNSRSFDDLHLETLILRMQTYDSPIFPHSLLPNAGSLVNVDLTLSSSYDEVSDSIRSMGQFLMTKCSKLQSLRIDITKVDLSDPELASELGGPTRLSLANCPSLQTLHWRLYTSTRRLRDAIQHWKYLIYVLSTVSRTITQVVVGIYLHELRLEDSTPGDGKIPWAQLDAALLSLGELNRVRLQREQEEGDEDRTTAERAESLSEAWVSVLQDRLPRVHTRGLLEFT